MRHSAKFAAVLLLTSVVPVASRGGDIDEPVFVKTYPPEMEGARVETYRTVAAKPTDTNPSAEVKLNAYIFEPANHTAKDSRAAIVFFFGGGWSSGSPGQFYSQCRHLSKRGMVAITVDYRVEKRNGTLPQDSVVDAKAAIRWVRANAARLGIDPNRIAAGGGSAGGHLAAATGVLQGFGAANEDESISAFPNAMVLFNPAVVLANSDDSDLLPADKAKSMDARTKGKSLSISPYHHLRKGICPTIIFHGTNDDAVAYPTVVAFQKKMLELGNQCELVSYKDQPHGFFNPGRGPKDNSHRDYKDTLRRTDAFLVSLGYLTPEANDAKSPR